jgi:hypothetical protein
MIRSWTDVLLRLRQCLTELHWLYDLRFVLHRSHRNQLRRAVIEAFYPRYRWGVSYSVWDGEELLEGSLRSIRRETDYINVVYQTHSWYGKPASEGLLPLLHRLQAEGLIDELLEYKANPAVRASLQERRKRNQGLAAAKRAGCHYFMTMDADEFYDADEMKAGKAFILQHDVTRSMVGEELYVFKPIYRVGHNFNQASNFFSKLTWGCRLQLNPHYPTLVDPTRQLSHHAGAKYYVLNNVTMYHMGAVRTNLNKKYENTSATQVRQLQLEGAALWPDTVDGMLATGKASVVPNRFGLTVNMDEAPPES